MQQQNIQKRQCQATRDVFEAAKDPRKVMVIGIDAAKTTHKAGICNGLGDQFCKAFDLRNDAAGVAFLESRIAGLCRKFSIQQQHLVIGLETPGSWAENFADTLVTKGFTVINLHPADVKKYRENATTDNDQLSAQTICRCLNQQEGRLRRVDDPYSELLMLSRHHARLVRQRTRTCNRITTFCDMYFPGLLDPERSDIVPFSEASLQVMEKLSIRRVRRMPIHQLQAELARWRATHPQQKAQKLKELAEQTLVPTPEKERCMHFELQHLMEQHRLLCQQIDRVAQEMGCLLRQTPFALLTTIGGIGVSLATQITAEFYGRDRKQGAESKVHYGGLTARSRQTGGAHKPPQPQGKAKKINRHAKRNILMAAESVARHDKEDLTEYYDTKKRNGKNAKCALGRKLLRFCDHLLVAPEAYLPARLRNGRAPKESLTDYYRELARKLQAKWKTYPKQPPRERDMLEAWMEMTSKLYQTDFSSLRNQRPIPPTPKAQS